MGDLDFLNQDAPTGPPRPGYSAPPAAAPAAGGKRDSSLDFLTQDEFPAPGTKTEAGPNLGWSDVPGALMSGVRHGMGDIKQTFAGGEGSEESPASAPFAWSDIGHPGSGAAKLAYRVGEGSPTIAGGIAGGMVGSAVSGPGAPVGGILGGAAGAAGMSMLQTMGPAFAKELKASPDDPDGAWTRAVKSTLLSGAFTGTAWAAFPMKFFEGPLKNLAFQALGIQPGLAVGHQTAENVMHDRPPLEGAGQAYTEGAVGTALPMLGRRAGEATGLIKQNGEQLAIKAADKARKAEPPTADQLDEIAKGHYQDLENAKITYTGRAELEQLRDHLRKTLIDAHIDPDDSLYSSIFRQIDKIPKSMQDPIYDANGDEIWQPPTWAEVNHRRGTIAVNLKHNEGMVRRAANIALRGDLETPGSTGFLDWFADPAAQTRAGVAPSLAPELAQKMTLARSYYRAARGMEAFDDILEKANNSSNDEKVAFRNAIRSIVNGSPAKKAQFPPEAIELMRDGLQRGWAQAIAHSLKLADPHSSFGLFANFLSHSAFGAAGLALAPIAMATRALGMHPLNRVERGVPRIIGAQPTGGLPPASTRASRTQADYTPYTGPLTYQPQQQARGGKIKKALRLATGGPVDDDEFEAYHGSPYDFDQFDSSKIGTGEGGASFGHGLYFAGNKHTAKTYKDSTSDLRDWRVVGGDPDWRVPSWLGKKASFSPAALDESIEDFTNRAKQMQEEGHWNAAGIQGIVDALQAVKAGKATLEKPGKLYTVGISGNPEHFLDWDKQWHEQPPAIQKLLAGSRLFGGAADPLDAVPGRKSVVKKVLGNWVAIDNATTGGYIKAGSKESAQRIADNLNHRVRNEEFHKLLRHPKSAELLRDAGIPGIRYLDQGSRSAGEGTRNYVVFDDKKIKVRKKEARGGDVERALRLAGGGSAPDLNFHVPRSLPDEAPDAPAPEEAPQGGYMGNLRDAYNAATAMTQSGYHDIGHYGDPISGIPKAVMGSVGSVMSPFNAAVKTLVEDPATSVGGEDFGRKAGFLAGLPGGGEAAASKAMFFAPSAVTMNRIRELQAQGATAKDIWRETNTFRDAAGDWRYEQLGPSSLKIKPSSVGPGQEARHTLGEVVDMPHLFDPMAGGQRMLNMPVRIFDFSHDPNFGPTTQGAYFPYKPTDFGRVPEQIWLAPHSTEPLSTVHHEAQHALDQPAGFLRSIAGDPYWYRKVQQGNTSSPEARMFYEELAKFPMKQQDDPLVKEAVRQAVERQRYRRSIHEVMARNSAKREDLHEILGPEYGARWAKDNPPQTTEDIPRIHQLIGPKVPYRRGGKVKRALATARRMAA